MPPLPKSPAPSQPGSSSASMYPSGATPSQLDIIAEINERAARQHRGRRARRIGLLVGGAMLLGAALWWAWQGGAGRAPTTLLPAAAVLTETLRDTLGAGAHGTPGASAVAGQVLPDAAPAQRAPTASAPMEATAAPRRHGSARQARAQSPQRRTAIAARAFARASPGARTARGRAGSATGERAGRRRQPARGRAGAATRAARGRGPARREGTVRGQRQHLQQELLPRSRMPQTRARRRRHLHSAARDRATTAERKSVAGGRASAMQGPVTCM